MTALWIALGIVTAGGVTMAFVFNQGLAAQARQRELLDSRADILGAQIALVETDVLELLDRATTDAARPVSRENEAAK